MRVLLVEHESSLRHDTGFGHPERASRIPAVISGVHASRLDVISHEPEPAGLDEIALVHDPGYIRQIRHFCAEGGGASDFGDSSKPAAKPASQFDTPPVDDGFDDIPF